LSYKFDTRYSKKALICFNKRSLEDFGFINCRLLQIIIFEKKTNDSKMDLSKLKRRPSYPFETVAVAISFSPSCMPILQEAKRIADICGAALILLHIGDKSAEKDRQLDEMMAKAGINPNQSRVIWMEGEPVDTILRLCKLNIVDLLVLGALEKENLFKFYIGSIARNISRKAKCSVLLLTNPGSQLQKFKKIIVNGAENPKTIHTINTALYLAKRLTVKEVTIVNEVDMPGLAMVIADDSTAPEAKEIKKNINEDSQENLHSLIDQCDAGDIRITQKIIKGKPGYAISKYASDKNADLLVINSPDTNLNLFDRIFTHDIEFILADLPCNVLIVHSRVSAE
jgi:nucleotide-binding universal stress UspA family protein